VNGERNVIIFNWIYIDITIAMFHLKGNNNLNFISRLFRKRVKILNPDYELNT
jgi:hypothetical protein